MIESTRRRALWLGFGAGWLLGSVVLLPFWLALLAYCLWEIAHGR